MLIRPLSAFSSTASARRVAAWVHCPALMNCIQAPASTTHGHTPAAPISWRCRTIAINPHNEHEQNTASCNSESGSVMPNPQVTACVINPCTHGTDCLRALPPLPPFLPVCLCCFYLYISVFLSVCWFSMLGRINVFIAVVDLTSV